MRVLLRALLLLVLASALVGCVRGGPPSQYPAIRATYLGIGATSYPVVPTVDLAEAALGGLREIDPAFSVQRSGMSLRLTRNGVRLAEFAPNDEWGWQQPLEDALRAGFGASPATQALSLEDRQIVIINAMLRRVSPHARYSPDIDWSARVKADAEVGLGATWVRQDDRLIIQSVQPGGAAALHQVEPGDAIVAIASVPVGKIGDQRLAEGLGAPIRWPFKITLARKNPARSPDIYLGSGTRQGLIGWHDGLVLIRAPAIERGSGGASGAHELARELQKLFAKHEAEQVKGIVLDLRGNSGGRLFDSAAYADLFLPYGPVAVVQRRVRAQEQIFDSTNGFGTFGTLIALESAPMVVIVDGETASGAEMVAGAVQLRQRGVVIGTATRGFPHIDLSVSLRQVGLAGSVRIPNGRIILPGAEPLPTSGLAPTVCVYDMGGDANSRVEFGLARMAEFAGRPRATLTAADWAKLPYLCPADAAPSDDAFAIGVMIAQDRPLYDRLLQSVPPNHFARHEDYIRSR